MAYSKQRENRRRALRDTVWALVGTEQGPDAQLAARRILTAAAHYRRNQELADDAPRILELAASLEEIDKAARKLSTRLDSVVPYLVPLYISQDHWRMDYPDVDPRTVFMGWPWDKKAIQLRADDTLRTNPRRIARELETLSINMRHVANLIRIRAEEEGAPTMGDKDIIDSAPAKDKGGGGDLFVELFGHPKTLFAMELAQLLALYHPEKVTGTHVSKEKATFHEFCMCVFQVATGEPGEGKGVGLFDHVKMASKWHRKGFPLVPTRDKQRRAKQKRSSPGKPD